MKGNLQGQYAGGVTRGVAWAIDQVLIIITLALVSWLVSSSFQLLGIQIDNCGRSGNGLGTAICYGVRWSLIGFAILISPVYLVFFWTATGQTIGDAILGIRVVRTDGKQMTVPRSIRRFIGYILCFLTLGIGFALILVDDQRQGLHDSLAGTCVIYAWRGEQNVDTVQRVQNWMNRNKRPEAQTKPLDS